MVLSSSNQQTATSVLVRAHCAKIFEEVMKAPTLMKANFEVNLVEDMK